MANTTFFWTLGVWLIQHDGMKEAKIDFKQALGVVLATVVWLYAGGGSGSFAYPTA